MRKLFFIRHGLSKLNVEGLYAGRTETPLVEEGRLQAKKASKLVKEHRIDLIVSSPLSRSLETAQIVAREIGYPLNKIVVDNRLIERDFGKLETQPWSSSHTYRYQLEHGAESNKKLLERTRQVLDWIESQPAENILVIGHGASGRALRSLVKKDYPLSRPSPLINAELHQWL